MFEALAPGDAAFKPHADAPETEHDKVVRLREEARRRLRAARRYDQVRKISRTPPLYDRTPLTIAVWVVTPGTWCSAATWRTT